MTDTIDSTEMLEQTLTLVGAADALVEKLDRDNPNPTPEKAHTLGLIKLVVNTQSQAIRSLVEDRLQINDQMNALIERHNL
jgi:hypothetical protein